MTNVAADALCRHSAHQLRADCLQRGELAGGLIPARRVTRRVRDRGVDEVARAAYDSEALRCRKLGLHSRFEYVLQADGNDWSTRPCGYRFRFATSSGLFFIARS